MRIFGGVPAKECDCDRKLLKLLGEFRHGKVSRLLVIYVGPDVRGEDQDPNGMGSFTHDIDSGWLAGDAMEEHLTLFADAKAKEELR